MENTNKERQVWQRVMAPAQSWAEADWQQLLNPAALSAGAYRYLMGALPPEYRSVAARLYRESLETLACLKGLCRLQGQHPGRVQPVPVGRETVDQVLTQSYHRARKAAAEYTARWGEPEWGCVYRELSRREENHCMLLAQLMGR